MNDIPLDQIESNSMSYPNTSETLVANHGGTPFIEIEVLGDALSGPAIQKAIDSLAGMGGGTVRLLPGKHTSGTLVLRSGITLEIMANAVLKGSANPTDYLAFQSRIISRMDVVPWKAFLFAQGEENIRICGGGIIDASGDAPGFQDGKDNSPDRPYGLHFIDCRNVIVENLRLRNSAFWMQRYFSCERVRLHRLDVWNHANLNNDGIDLDSSRDAVVSDCRIDASDDALCIKSEGERPARDIVVSNCLLATHASGFKLGTGSVGGFQNIVASNLVIKRSASTVMKHVLGHWEGITALDLSTTDGGPLRSALIHNVVIEGFLQPMLCRLGNRLSGNVVRQGYGGNGDSLQGVVANERTARIEPVFDYEDVAVANVIARDTGPLPIVIAGHEGHHVRRITLRDITLVCARPGSAEDLDTPPSWQADGYPGCHMFRTKLPAYGLTVAFAEDVSVENVNAIPAPGEPRPERFLFMATAQSRNNRIKRISSAFMPSNEEAENCQMIRQKNAGQKNGDLRT